MQKCLRRNTLIIANLLVYVPKVTTVYKPVYVGNKRHRIFTKLIKLWKLYSQKFLSCLFDEYTQTFYSTYPNINSDLKRKGNELYQIPGTSNKFRNNVPN